MFLFLVGILITHVTGSFNLASCAKYKFNPFFIDVLIFLTILYADYNKKVSQENLLMAYLAMIAVRGMLYICFMASMVKQICQYMQIPFIRVK
jgi:hypothetical protein